MRPPPAVSSRRRRPRQPDNAAAPCSQSRKITFSLRQMMQIVLMKVAAAPLVLTALRVGEATHWAVRVLLEGIMLAGLCFLGTSLLIAGLAAAYTLKRALNIDVVPGVDVLPDEEIEALISAVLSMLGF